MIRKSFQQFLRVAKQRVFTGKYDQHSLYYEEPLASKIIPKVIKVAAGLCGVSLCMMPTLFYFDYFGICYKQKFVTDAEMLPYRFPPPEKVTNVSNGSQFNAHCEWGDAMKPQRSAAKVFIKDKYNERKDDVPWKTKLLFAKEAHVQSCEFLNSMFLASKRVVLTRDIRSLVDWALLLEDYVLRFYYTKKAEEDEGNDQFTTINNGEKKEGQGRNTEM
eukprot:CAMPEP_0185013894 /NCGR_PEP_ID=MMETSP1098-20130426/99038_1 /TAXON_ID=89044 /ORGANISM="Spumella elongata, Strain CCAP 955/1" /LENGTH=217 /DNA_ID=CAMNT_0027542967 /DNA_START=59 /DNA_END=712 /DNA_ORIENTATION=+